MPQIYEAELSDGRIVEFESDHEPTHDEILRALSSQPQKALTLPQGPNPKFMSPVMPPEPSNRFGETREDLGQQMLAAKWDRSLGNLAETAAGVGERIAYTAADALARADITGITANILARQGVQRTPSLISPEVARQDIDTLSQFVSEGLHLPPRAPEGTVGQLAEGAKQFGAEFGAGMTDVPLLGAMAAAKKIPEAGKILARVVQGQMLSGIPGATESLFEAQNLAEATKGVLNVGSTVGFPLLIEAGLLRSARMLPEAAAEAARTVPSPRLSPQEQIKIIEEGTEERSTRSLRPSRPVVPEYEEPMEAYETSPGDLAARPAAPIPTVPVREIATWDEAVAELRVRGKGNETRAEIQQLLPEISLSKEAAGKLGRAAWGNAWNPTVKKKGVPDASSIEEAAAVHGDVRPQPGESQGQMSIEESGKGIQPQAARRVEKEAQVLLTPDEQAYLDAERKGMDVDVQVTPTLPGDQPFAGLYATVDRPNQRILVNPKDFSDWLHKLPKKDWPMAVRSLLSEERIHLAVEDEQALAYLNTLTAAEKLIQRRRYTGSWRGIDPRTEQPISDVLLGHEALRFRLQQLARITPREIAETNWLSREGFTVRSITALEGAVRAVRETLGTKASSEAVAILDRVQGNLDAAKAVLAAGQEPAALRKKQLQDVKQENLFLPPIAETAGLERGAPKPSALEVQRNALELEGIAQRHVDEAFAAGKIPDFEAFRSGVGLDREKLFYLWRDAILKRLPTLKGKDVEHYVEELKLVKDIAEGLKPGEKEPRIGGAIPDPQVFTRGQQIVMPELGKVSKAQYARQMAPEQRRRHAAIAGIFDKLMQKAGPKPEKPWTRATIGREDIRQMFYSPDAPPKAFVEKIGVENIEPPTVVTKPMYRRFLPEEAKDPAIVGKLATTGAAIEASGKGAPPRTVSRNVVALKERSSGKVVLVNAFRDPRSGPKVTNPTAANLEAQNISPALIEKYQPVAVMSLRDPVKNFRQVFDSLEAFHKEFGDVAMEGTPGLRTSSFAGPERGIVESQAGLSRPTSAPRPETLENVLLRDIEAPVSPTARELTKRERLAPTVVRGETLPKEPGPTPRLPMPTASERLAGWQAPEPVDVTRSTLSAPSYDRPTGKIVEYGKPEKLQPGTIYRAGLQPELAKRAPAALIKPAKDFAKKTIVNAVVDPLRVYSEWMSERIARVGGPVSKAFSDAANIIIDREKEIYGTELTPTLDIARRAAGKLGKASTWANKVKPITDKAGVSNAVEAVEGRLAAPTYARPLIDLTKAANLEIGKVHQRGSPAFVATGKWERHLTAVGYDIMRSGDTPLRQAWEDGLAKVNYNPHGTTTLADWKTRAHDFFVKWKAILDEPAPDMATIEKVNQDFHRYFPKAPTHLKINGLWQPVIHGKIYDYLEAAARRASHVAAFRESFPLKSRNAFNNMLKDVRAELPADVQQDLDGLIRAMNGHPTDTYSSSPILGPGKFWGESFSFLNNTLGNLFAKLVLSNQLFVQPGENIAGSTPVFLGYKNYLRAAAELTSQPNHVLKMMEQEGAINRAMYDFSYDPSSPVRSAFRITGNAISRTFFEQWLNEVQEVHAATTAAVVTERIKNNQLDTWEKRMLPQTFKMMGFDPGQVVEMMRGNPDLLGQFERKAAAFLTSGNKAIAEGSSIAGNRMFNSIFRFQTYPMMKMNQFRKVTGNFVEAWSKGTGAEKAKATEMFTRFMLGNTVQGILTVALTTYAAQNIAGLAIRAHEAKDNPWHFMFDAFLATTGGPAYLLWRGATDQGVAGIPEQLQRMIFPMGVATELINFAQGSGPYRDKSASERIKKFLEQKLPGTRALKQGLAVAGLSKTDIELDSSIAAFYRWRRDALGYTTYEPFLKDKTRSDFRMHMRRAIDKIKKGDIDGYVEAVAKAEELVGEKEVKASLGSRRILQTPTGKELSPEELDQLTTHIGQRAVDKLMEFDAMLAELAK